MKREKIILFDGICNLCNTYVQWIIKRDHKALFSFASLQSNFGKKFLDKHNLNQSQFDTIILIDKKSFYKKSTAVLNIFKTLGGFYSILYIFIILPKWVRDPIYSFIAKNRYCFFGKKEVCWLPNDDLKNRFIED